MKKRLSIRLLSALLAFAACISPIGCKPQQTAEETVQPTAQIALAPTPTATPEPTPTPEPVQDAAGLLAELEQEIFTAYLSSSGYRLRSLISDPARFGLETLSVPMGWGDYSGASCAENAETSAAQLRRLEEIDRSLLDEKGQLNYDVLHQYLSLAESGAPFDYYEEPLAPQFGIQTALPNTLQLFELRSAEDVEAYLALVADTPRYLAQILAYEQKRAELGLFMPERALDTVLAEIDRLTATKNKLKPADMFAARLEELPDLTAEQRDAYGKQATELYAGAFTDGFKELRKGLNGLRKSCSKPQGMYLCGAEGKAYYAYRLALLAANEMTPEEMLALLEQELVFLLLSYQTLALTEEGKQEETLPLTGGDAAADMESLLQFASGALAALPAHTYELRRIPKAQASKADAVSYIMPPIDGWQTNTVLLNEGADQSYLFLSLAREAYPGHMYRHVYQQSLEGLGLMQRILDFPGYFEGWASFAEELAILWQTDYNRSTTMMRFCNEMVADAVLPAIVSIQVNYRGMDQNELRTYLADFQPGLGDAAFVKAYYNMAIDYPFYGFSRAIGYAQLADTMRSLSAELGESYLQREALVRLLDYGPAYFDLVRERLDVWADGLVKKS